jgi:hypothetical protein
MLPLQSGLPICFSMVPGFLNLPVDAESLLVQARSFGLSLVLAHQHLDQLPDSIRSAVMANARSKVVFQTTYDDARVFCSRVRADGLGRRLHEPWAYQVLADWLPATVSVRR